MSETPPDTRYVPSWVGVAIIGWCMINSLLAMAALVRR